MSTPSRVGIVATNRTGSTLLFRLVSGVLDAARVAPPEGRAAENARDRFDAWQSAFEEATPEYPFRKTGVSRLGGVDLVGARAGEFVFVTGARVDRADFDRVHVCYAAPPQAESTRFAEDRTVFVPVRHPLDVLVSHAFELEHLLAYLCTSEAFRTPQSPLREAFGAARLGSAEWVRGAATYVGTSLQSQLALEPAPRAIRYEDVLEDPLAAIASIADACGVELTEDAARAIWAEVDGAPLKDHATHRFRPGTGKWRRYLDVAAWNVAEEAGLIEFARTLGYEANLVAEPATPESPPLPSEETEELSLALAVGDAMNEMMFGTPVVFSHPSLVRTSVADRDGTRYQILSNRAIRGESIAAWLERVPVGGAVGEIA